MAKKGERFFRYYFDGKATMAVDQSDESVFRVAFAFRSPKDQQNKKMGRKVALGRLDNGVGVFSIKKELVKQQEGLHRALAYVMQGIFVKAINDIKTQYADKLELQTANLFKQYIDEMERQHGGNPLPAEAKEEAKDYFARKQEKLVRLSAYESICSSLGLPYWFLRELISYPAYVIEEIAFEAEAN